MIRKYGLYVIWVIAALGTLGSLYLNEVQYLPPCHLCWYQKVCMYPIAIIAGIAAWRGFYGIADYLIPQALIGVCLAALQLFLQSYSNRSALPIQICSPGPDCTETIAFGISSITLPVLSFLSFLIISVLLFFIRNLTKETHEK